MALPAGVRVTMSGTTAFVYYRDAAGDWRYVGTTSRKGRLCRMIRRAEARSGESWALWQSALGCGERAPYQPIPGDDDIPLV